MVRKFYNNGTDDRYTQLELLQDIEEILDEMRRSTGHKMVWVIDLTVDASRKIKFTFEFSPDDTLFDTGMAVATVCLNYPDKEWVGKFSATAVREYINQIPGGTTAQHLYAMKWQLTDHLAPQGA